MFGKRDNAVLTSISALCCSNLPLQPSNRFHPYSDITIQHKLCTLKHKKYMVNTKNRKPHVVVN